MQTFKPKTVFRITGIALTAFMLVSNGLVLALSAIASKMPSFNSLLSENQLVNILLNYACIYGIGFLIYWLIMRSLPHTLPAEKTFSFKELFQFFCIGYALAISSNIIGTVFSLFSGNQTDIASEITDLVGASGIASWIVMILVAPVVEELIFRKLIIDRTKKYGEKYAIVFSAVCFGLFHMNIQQFLYAMSIGMVFGFVYSRSGKIHYTIIMHSLINALGYLVVMAAGPMLESMQDLSVSSFLNGNGSDFASLDIRSMAILWVLEQLILVIIALGIVFFIRKIRKLRFDYSSPQCLQKKEAFRTVWLNVGVIVFVLICAAGMVISFLGGLSNVLS